MATASEEKARKKVKKAFDAVPFAPGAASNKTLEGVVDKLREVLGRKIKKNGGQ